MLDALSSWIKFVELHFPGLLKKVKSLYYNTVINTCQYLAQKNDIIGEEKFLWYQKQINSNSGFIFLSEYITLNNKFKLILFKANMFRLFFRLLKKLNLNFA